MQPDAPRFDFGFLEFVSGSMLLLGLTFAGLFAARVYRDGRDASLTTASGGWRFRSQLDFDPGDPFSRFKSLQLVTLRDVMEGVDDGFEVAYFDWPERRFVGPPVVRPAALIQLPVEGPRPGVRMGGSRGHDLGPGSTEAIQSMTDMVIETESFALLVRSTGAPADRTQRMARVLAKAIVDDARDGRASGSGNDATPVG